MFGEIEQELIYKTWEDFNSRSDRSDDIEYTIAESRLFQIVLKGSNAERQLAYLIERSDGNPELLAIENSFADRDGDTLDRLLGSISYTHKQQIQEILQFICQNSQNLSLVMMQELILPKAQLLFDLFKSSSYKQIERILWYISYNSQNLPLKTVRKYVLDYIFHPNEIVRFLAIKTLYHSGLQPVIQDFLDSQWGWSDRHRSFENYWGSILLAKYGGELPYSALAKRVEPDYLGILVRERGLRADEISEFANFIDLAWDEIVLLKIALPNDLPSIEVEAIDSNGGYREPDIELSDRYFSRSLKSIGRLYHWGGIRRSEQLANNNFIDRERQCEGYMNNLSKIANEFVLGHDCSKNPLLFGQIPVDVLSEIVISHPESISKWLEPIAPYQDRAWAQRIVSACSHFYEKLCAALLKRSDKRGIELYNFLSQMERKVKLRDARTNIYFLDTAIFGIPQTASISTDIWQKRLKDCRSDLELMEICIAAQQGNGGEWLKSYAAKNLESDIPLDFAYGSTLLGFLNTNTAKDLLQQQIDLQPVSWRGRSVKLSLERWQHDSWARYWFEAFIHESIPDLAWSRFRLFLQCVDRRYWLWKKELINDVSNQPHSHLSRNLEFLEDNANTIQNSIKTNEKPYQDNFLGQKIEERQAWPLL